MNFVKQKFFLKLNIVEWNSVLGKKFSRYGDSKLSFGLTELW